MYRRILTAIAVIGAMSAGSLAWSHVGQTQAQRLAHSQYSKAITFATDPAVFGGGDQGMDNLYTLDSFVCTDGIAINIADQIVGDIGNVPADQGHSLELSSIQDYGMTAPTLPLGFDTAGVPTAGTNVPIQEANGTDNGYTFATAPDNSSGSWQGNTYKAHYGTTGSPITKPVGEQIVGSIVRADHGFIVNEDDDIGRTDPGTLDLKSNGDDGRFNQYKGWGGTDDGGTGNTPPTTPNLDGDWASYVNSSGQTIGPTDGSSFDDIVRTDQSPTSGLNPSDPNSAPSFMVAPNPDTSRVSDCVIDQAAPQTSATISPSTPDSTGWYKGSVNVTLTPHKVYYASTGVTVHFQVDNTGEQTAPGEVVATLSADGVHTVSYFSVDSLNDVETTKDTVPIKIDNTPPSAHFTNCPSGPVPIGSLMSASWAASDPSPGSGLSTPSAGSVSLDTNTPGQHSVSTPAPQDVAGNTGVAATCVYTVQYGVKLLYKPPMTQKSGSTVPIKLELVDAHGTNLSSSGLAVQALCVVPQGSTSCSSAPTGFTYSNQFFTFLASLDNGGGYQFNVKSTGLTIGHTYQLLFDVAGESASTTHSDALATFTLTK